MAADGCIKNTSDKDNEGWRKWEMRSEEHGKQGSWGNCDNDDDDDDTRRKKRADEYARKRKA